MTDGSGVEEGSGLGDSDGAPIISVGQNPQGLVCVLRSCVDTPESSSDVDQACPVQAQAVVEASQFGRGKVPNNFNLAKSGTTASVKSECWKVLAAPVLRTGVLPDELAKFRVTVAFSGDCKDKQGTEGETCRLLEAAANFPATEDPTSSPATPTEDTRGDTPSPNSTPTTLGPAPGEAHHQPHGTQQGEMVAVLQQFWDSWTMDPFANNSTPVWVAQGNELYQLSLNETANLSIPIHPAQAAIMRQQHRQAGIQAQTWRVQRYFAIGMAVAALLTVIGTLIILAKACYNGYRGCKGWTQRKLQENNQKGHERRERRRLLKAQKAFQDMKDCGIVLSASCGDNVPRQPTDSETTNCHVGGPEAENSLSALDTTHSMSLSDAPMHLQVRANFHDTACNGWCQGERKPDKTTPSLPAISKMTKPETLVVSGSVASLARLPPASLTEIPPNLTLAESGHLRGVPNRGPVTFEDVSAYLMEPHEIKAVSW